MRFSSDFEARIDKFLRIAQERGRDTLRKSITEVAKIMRRALRASAGIHGGSGEPLGPDDVTALRVLGIEGFENMGGGCYWYCDSKMLPKWIKREEAGEDNVYAKADRDQIARIADSILPRARRAKLRDQITFVLLPMEEDDASKLLLDDLG